MLTEIGFSSNEPKGLPQSLKYSHGHGVAKPSEIKGTSRNAVDLLKAQNAELYLREKLAELTYGPKRPEIRPFVPSYVKMDKKILQFEGVIHDKVQDWWTEKKRVHLVKLLFFLETDTIKVIEPKVPNSGLYQGTLIAQDRYMAPCKTRYYHWKDLNIGKDITIYGKIIHLYDCDRWTREYMNDMGVELNKPEPRPEDPIHLERRAMEARKETRNADKGELYPTSRFFEYGDKVLKFYGIFKNDQESPFGVRRITLKYYLGDGALDIVENCPPNRGKIGKGSWVTIISKQKVLADRRKDMGLLPCYLEPIDEDHLTWITPEYLKTGEDLQILGKTFFLNKCDNFTKDFYMKNFGVDLPQIEIAEKPKPCQQMLVPPHEYGKWEESIEDCFKPHAKPNVKVTKILNKSKELENTVLRFSAFIDTTHGTEQDRAFVISYFMEDDTVKIHEIRVENSGHTGGAFFARGPLRKDLGKSMELSSSLAQGARPQYYGPEDFYVGAKIRANGATFVVKDADLAVFRFMEKHPEIFPDINAKEQIELADYLKGYIKPKHSERMQLLENLHKDIAKSSGSSSLPYPSALDLGSLLQPRALVEDKLYCANLPFSRSSLQKLLDAFTFKGRTDADEVTTFLKVALGHTVRH